MITAYVPSDRGLVARSIDQREQLVPEALWLDLERPSIEELHWIKAAYDQNLPTIDSLIEIEASSRFFQDESGLHVRSYFLHETPGRTYNVTVAFILNQGRLFTLRNETLVSFQIYRRKAEAEREREVTAVGIMLDLIELKVDSLADLLEQLYIELETLNTRVFHAEERNFEEVLAQLAVTQDRNDKARLSLMDKQRALSFLLRGRNCPEEEVSLLREILRDIQSLNEHSTFLFEKMQFLMDATLGQINIEQNKIIKIFSIAAVVFLPPTLVASIYGMNFHLMPELKWDFGYPLAIVIMLLSGAAPYLFFKRRGWL